MKRRRFGGAQDCAWPAREAGKPPRFAALPAHVVGCTYAAHGNSSARYPSKGPQPQITALSMHATPNDKQTLFNVHAPVIFKNAKLVVNQAAAKRSVREARWQEVQWPRPISCDDANPCPGKNQRCRISGARGRCESFRRVKAPMGYVYGQVYPDDPQYSRLATSIKFYAGDFAQDGTWIPAKFVDIKCSRETGNDAACPAITSARVVRFQPNYNTGEYPQPFTVTLEGRRQVRRRRRR